MAIWRLNPQQTIPIYDIWSHVPILGPNTNRKSKPKRSAINKKSKMSFHIISPRWISIFPTPQIKIPPLVAGPPMALALLKGEAIGVDVGVGNDFVDKGHGQSAG